MRRRATYPLDQLVHFIFKCIFLTKVKRFYKVVLFKDCDGNHVHYYLNMITTIFLAITFLAERNNISFNVSISSLLIFLLDVQ